jgi:hypothetical protein
MKFRLVLAVGDPIDVRSIHAQSLRNARVVKTAVVFVKIVQGHRFFSGRPLLSGLRVNRTVSSSPSAHCSGLETCAIQDQPWKRDRPRKPGTPLPSPLAP